MSVELRHLRAFHAVASELNFRRASERLHIAQPAVSRTIKDLEALLGVTLLQRTTRVVGLTDAGRSFQKGTRDLLNQLDRSIQRAQRVQNGMAGELRVGFNDFAINGDLPEIIRLFRQAAPEVEVSLSEATSPEMVDLLLDGTLDVGFYMGPHHHPRLERLIVREERLVCVLPSSHRLATRDAVSIVDLASEPFVLGSFQTWRVFHRLLRDFCRAYGFDPPLIQEAVHSDGIMALVAAGIGITLYVDAEWIHGRRGVVVRPLKESPPRIVTQGAWRRDRRRRNAPLDQFVTAARSVVDRRARRRLMSGGGAGA